MTPAPPFPNRRLCRVGISLLSARPAMQCIVRPACRYYEGAKTARHPSRPARFSLATRYLRGLCLFARCRTRACTTAPGRWSAGGVPVRHLYGGEAELSHLPRKPSRVFALVSDPGPASTPCQYRRFGAVPLPMKRRTLDDLVTFRGSFSQLRHSLSTLRAALADDDARLACGWHASPLMTYALGLPFPRGIRTHRVPIECFSFGMFYVIPLPPHSLSFDGATRAVTPGRQVNGLVGRSSTPYLPSVFFSNPFNSFLSRQ